MAETSDALATSSQGKLITAGVVILLFLGQGIIMFLEVVALDPMFLGVGQGTTMDLEIGPPEAGVLIHTIMILLHREGRIMTAGITFQIEAGAAGFKEAEVIIARAAAKLVIAVKDQGTPPARAGRQPPSPARNYLLIKPAVKLVSFLGQSQRTT